MCANEVESLGKEKEKLHEIKKISYSKWGHFARFSALYVWFFCHFVFYLSFAKIAGRVQLLHWPIRALDQTLNRYTSSALLSSVTRVQCFEGYLSYLSRKAGTREVMGKGAKLPGKGGYSWEFLVGVCCLVLQILILFQMKKCHFYHLFSDQTSLKLCRHYLDKNSYKKQGCH